jgi:hypothetical protein
MESDPASERVSTMPNGSGTTLTPGLPSPIACTGPGLSPWGVDVATRGCGHEGLGMDPPESLPGVPIMIEECDLVETRRTDLCAWREESPSLCGTSSTGTSSCPPPGCRALGLPERVTEFQRVPDEAIGLPAGFLQAGVPGVVATLWPVNDVSTAVLVTEFYRPVLQEKMEPAAALSGARICLRDSTRGELDLAPDGTSGATRNPEGRMSKTSRCNGVPGPPRQRASVRRPLLLGGVRVHGGVTSIKGGGGHGRT